MKLLFLIPPSEGKNKGGECSTEDLAHFFEKPIDIAINATEKDLKCIDKRYEEAIHLNKNLSSTGEYIPAIERYSGVMYNAINFTGMSELGSKFFVENFGILSGMYGLVNPLCKIGNYKLPIETKGLYKFWGEKISDKINEIKPDYVINLLPGSYLKMLNIKTLDIPLININFQVKKEDKIVKMAHGVKKVKGEWIKNICENQITDYTKFGGEVIMTSDKIIDINIL